eukprot:3598704-Rhodomonas_salina.1
MAILQDTVTISLTFSDMRQALSDIADVRFRYRLPLPATPRPAIAYCCLLPRTRYYLPLPATSHPISRTATCYAPPAIAYCNLTRSARF